MLRGLDNAARCAPIPVPEQTLFGERRLLDCLNQAPVAASSGLAERLTEAVGGFAEGAPPSDDLTLVVRHRGP